MTRSRRPAGSDTREAMTMPSVKAAALTALAAAGPGWAAAIGAPLLFAESATLPPSVTAWLALASVSSGIAVAIAVSRGRSIRSDLTSDLVAAGVVGSAGIAPILAGTSVVTAALLMVLPVAAGWIVGSVAKAAMAACAPQLHAAAGGIVTSFALIGLLPGLHLGVLVAEGLSGAAALLCAAYAIVAVLAMLRMGRHLGTRDTSVVLDPRPPDGALIFRGIGLSFRDRPVLRSVDLEVARGEMVGLLGANGAGKSTLLRVAGGLATPHRGRVFLDGEDLTGFVPEERAAAGLAFVSGARPVFPDLTVIENLRVAAYRSHASAAAFKASTAAVFDVVPALAPRASSKAGLLSGGEQRLLAVAQTLYSRPISLLADELTLGLDPESREAVLDLLRHLAHEGLAVMVVDHDLETLIPRCDAAAVLHEGEVTLYRPAAEVFDAPEAILPATFLAGASR